jgi:hypothetical protein
MSRDTYVSHGQRDYPVPKLFRTGVVSALFLWRVPRDDVPERVEVTVSGPRLCGYRTPAVECIFRAHVYTSPRTPHRRPQPERTELER